MCLLGCYRETQLTPVEQADPLYAASQAVNFRLCDFSVPIRIGECIGDLALVQSDGLAFFQVADDRGRSVRCSRRVWCPRSLYEVKATTGLEFVETRCVRLT